MVSMFIHIERCCLFAYKFFLCLKNVLDKILRKVYIYCKVKIFLRR